MLSDFPTFYKVVISAVAGCTVALIVLGAGPALASAIRRLRAKKNS